MKRVVGLGLLLMKGQVQTSEFQEAASVKALRCALLAFAGRALWTSIGEKPLRL